MAYRTTFAPCVAILLSAMMSACSGGVNVDARAVVVPCSPIDGGSDPGGVAQYSVAKFDVGSDDPAILSRVHAFDDRNGVLHAVEARFSGSVATVFCEYETDIVTFEVLP